MRNTAESSDRHRCLKNNNPARACLRRPEGPRQSEVSLRIVIYLFIARHILFCRCSQMRLKMLVLLLVAERKKESQISLQLLGFEGRPGWA